MIPGVFCIEHDEQQICCKLVHTHNNQILTQPEKFYRIYLAFPPPPPRLPSQAPLSPHCEMSISAKQGPHGSIGYLYSTEIRNRLKSWHWLKCFVKTWNTSLGVFKINTLVQKMLVKNVFVDQCIYRADLNHLKRLS